MSRHEFARRAVMLGLAGAVAGPALAQRIRRAPTWVDPPDTEDRRLEDLVYGNRILFQYQVLDGWGHLSVRSLKNPKHFYMSRSRGPGAVTREDILEFDENSAALHPNGAPLYGERFIHGEIYRARPDVNSVMHAHTPVAVLFGVSKTPLRAVMSTSSFLGCNGIPIYFDPTTGSSFVGDSRTGAMLAKSLGKGPVVLMRAHGMAVVGNSVPVCVQHAISTKSNAEIEMAALQLDSPQFLDCAEAAGDGEGGQATRRWDMWVTDLKAKGLAPK